MDSLAFKSQSTRDLTTDPLFFKDTDYLARTGCRRHAKQASKFDTAATKLEVHTSDAGVANESIMDDQNLFVEEKEPLKMNDEVTVASENGNNTDLKKTGRPKLDLQTYQERIAQKIKSLDEEVRNAKGNKQLVRKLKNKQSAYKARLGKREEDLSNEKKLAQQNQLIKTLMKAMSQELPESQTERILNTAQKMAPRLDFSGLQL